MGSYDDVANWRHRVKRSLIEYKGGKCKGCGYDKVENLSAFSFHHRNPSSKSYNVTTSDIPRSLEERKKEADKCDLFCVRCHAEVHEEEYRKKRDARKHLQQRWLETIPCPGCDNLFKPIHRRQKYCSQVCWLKIVNEGKIRPSRDELEELVKTSTWEEIGRKYGVSGNAIRKWAKKHKIPFTTRTYKKQSDLKE